MILFDDNLITISINTKSQILFALSTLQYLLWIFFIQLIAKQRNRNQSALSLALVLSLTPLLINQVCA